MTLATASAATAKPCGSKMQPAVAPAGVPCPPAFVASIRQNTSGTTELEMNLFALPWTMNHDLVRSVTWLVAALGTVG